MANWGAGDGTYMDGSYGGYNLTDPSQDASQDVQIPLFNSGASTNSPLFNANASSGTSTSSNGLIVPSNSQFLSDSGGLNAQGNFISDSSSGLSSLGSLGTAGAIAGGVGSLVGSYENATTDTGTSVLTGVASGAATGAEIGSIVPGIGTAFGAVAGGVLGGLAGLFGSSSKKKQEKEAFQQQEQLAVLPAQQQQANYLQNEGLKQQAISNYASGYTPGGFSYTNGLLGHPSNKSFGVPTANPTLPNFNVSPTNVVPGSGNSSLGIAGQSTAANNVNLNPGSAASHASNPLTPAAFTNAPTGTNAFAAPTAMTAPTAPAYTKDKTAQNQALSQYQTDYSTYVANQNSLLQGNALNGYNQFYGG